ncbi:MAG: hypothetical protein E7225_03225 [Clostridiales bacterium]|nr:hypothetical protein [Clostridiales bacterium]
MLRIYYGRENVDKAKFIFENAGKDAIILVPDQFTLEAEKEAIRYLDAPGIMDLEILSISRLGFRMLSETGGIRKSRIDIYGRHILLTSVIDDLSEKGKLTAYGKLAGKTSFIELVNNFISGMKQHDVTPEGLAKIREEMSGRDILTRKLDDLILIFDEYEKQIDGRFLDTEDYIDMYIPAVSESGIVKDREIWVWGFDSFSPKNYKLIEELARFSDVNIMLTASYEGRDKDVFSLTRNLIKRFRESEVAGNFGFESIELPTPDIENNSVSGVLERELYAFPMKPCTDEVISEQLTLVGAANYYSEAETAAAYVLGLVREKGLKYKDILVVCNDLAGRSEIIKRVFAEYGLEIYTDDKKGILHEPLVVYVLSLIDIMSGSYRTKDVLSFLKTGFSRISRDRIEELENYALKYRIRSSYWKEPFKYGASEYGKTEFDNIEETRKSVMETLAGFEAEFKKSRRAKDRIQALYNFMSEDKVLKARVYENDMSQIWDAVMQIFDQIVNVIGDNNVSMETFGEMLSAGFSALKVGRIPPTADGLVLGTMQRTRAGNVKALVVIGANDGILPKEQPGEELLTEDEKEALIERGFDICELDKFRMQEEKVAIYRAFSRPVDYLYMSYAGSNMEGAEQKPSRIFGTVRKIFPGVAVLPDLDGRGSAMALIEGPDSSLNHLVRALREGRSGNLSEEWSSLTDWYKENEKEKFERATEGLLYTNRTSKLKKEVTEKLYKREGEESVILSPSRLEKFSRCPFAHFINYGLRLDERRVFEAGSREIGDVYHECLMIFSQKLKLIDEEKDTMWWNTVTREESDKLIEEIIEQQAGLYKEGLMLSGGEESYRKSRMNETLREAAWSLVLQARAGEIASMFYEEAFGRGDERAFTAIEVETSHGKVYIEGKIDRVDILSNGAVKIIDYKSGNEKWNTEEARTGWRLQLMLYLKAITDPKDGMKREPAGIFYFLIKDVDLSSDGKSSDQLKDDLAKQISREFRMNGLVVDSFKNVENIEASMDRYSEVVVNLQKVKAKPEDVDGGDGSGSSDPGYRYTGAVMTRDEFRELQDAFDKKIEELAEALVSGDVAARPKRIRDMTACRYCSYKSICRFDISFPGCNYEKIM